MRNILAVIGACAALTLVAHAVEEIDTKTAQTMKTVSCSEFESQALLLEGKIIKLKFNYRAASIVKATDGTSYTGSIQSYWETSRRRSVDPGWGSVRVRFPKEGLEWFTKLPTNLDTRSIVFVYAKVVADPEFSGMQAELIGKDMKTDYKGSKISW